MTAITATMIPKEKASKAILLFLLLTALFTVPAYYMVIELAQMSYYYGLMMWMPALAAFATCKIMGISFASLGWGFGASKWAWRSYLLPFFYISAAYGLILFLGLADMKSTANFLPNLMDRFGLAGWSNSSAVIFLLVLFLTVGFLRALSYAVGEEIGWRGFLVPLLMRHTGFTGTALISGIIWGLWHVPVLLFGNYAEQDLTLYSMGFWAYIVMLICISFPMTYYRLKSGSLWTGAIFHAAHNVAIYNIFNQIIVMDKRGQYWLSEFGLALPLAGLLVAAYFIRKANNDHFDHHLGT